MLLNFKIEKMKLEYTKETGIKLIISNELDSLEYSLIDGFKAIDYSLINHCSGIEEEFNYFRYNISNVIKRINWLKDNDEILIDNGKHYEYKPRTEDNPLKPQTYTFDIVFKDLYFKKDI